MKTIFRTGAAAVALCLPLLAVAQVPANNAPAPRQSNDLHYLSVLSDYVPWSAIEPADWRAVNDKVRDAASGGGHTGHTAASAPASAAEKSMPAHDHGGHHMRGSEK